MGLGSFSDCTGRAFGIGDINDCFQDGKQISKEHLFQSEGSRSNLHKCKRM